MIRTDEKRDGAIEFADPDLGGAGPQNKVVRFWSSHSSKFSPCPATAEIEDEDEDEFEHDYD